MSSIRKCAICGKGPREGVGVSKSGELFLCRDHLGEKDNTKEEVLENKGSTNELDNMGGKRV